MIKHLCKLVWNRKRANFLIAVEIFVSFLVLFAVVLLAVYFSNNYRQPLGFSYQNAWNVGIDMKQLSDDYFSPEQAETARQLYLALRQFDEVELAAGAHSTPFTHGGSFGRFDLNGGSIDFQRNEVTDDFNQVMGLKLTRGRWFGKDDDGANYEPVVINQTFAHERFGEQDPLGQRLNRTEDRVEQRVIGVVNAFRHSGEFADAANYLFERKNLNDPKQRPPRNLLIKLRPGTTRAFEEKLVARLQAVAKDWSFDVQPLTDLRDSNLKLALAPIIVGGVVVGFLMIMVGLGLTGVLWQSVTQRTKEIGLRRAKGATKQRIYRQILGELLIITTAGLVIGVLVVVQFPLLGVLGFASPKVYAYSIMISLALIYALTAVCGLYPSWLATKVQPADALHYE
ncbi:MAG: ABC transporter permease [Acidobacteriota bacterium]|nr:ABC transporter permease [Acidobacteriota bacterium]